MFAVMGREVLSFLLVWVGFAEMRYIMRGRDRSSRPPEAFPYPVFGRFAYRVSALVGHTLLGCLAGFACWTFFASVRQYQTPCTRTAGHWISEKPPAADCSGPWFWGRLGEGGRFWIFGLCFMGCEGMGGLFGSFRDEANVFYGGVGIVGMGIGYRCFRFFL